ncbi:polysaccharide biosynthesis/export family protein [Polaromonas naphthalenivorans]|uniref:Polysaccharide export protein n=1 Tax=Polaromonas naphthalenivorans (strain CJ2) TaxID=365044 RepID=A1VS66_POLNA|nr:polysaccharide biosynthesis/export family protein [Polaromonas naphthalenivorans]ABM38494.1 polysaccharide export protein [Polaromonas naphthalenivorans CJ2]
MALVVAWLGGCALAPGLSIGKGVQKASQSTPSSAGTSQESGAVSDQAPPGALLTITPELISQQRTLRKAELGADVKSLFAEAKPYGIGPGDVINIVVWNHPELVLAPAGATLTADASGLASVGNGYNVSPEGLIQFPLLGTFKIAGLTENKAREEITRRLAKFLQDPQVTLRVQAYRAGRIYVDGEVRTPGLQAINDIPMTLPEAISRAGGLTPTADRATVAVTRKGTTTMINMPQLSTLGVNPSSILLTSGDLLRVGSRDDTKVYVMGEVTRPMTLPLRNGRLTLNEALGEAGGVNATSGNPRQIYVVRSRNGDSATVADASGATTSSTPEIYHLDASSPTAYALSEGFELKSRDVVFVDPVPLVLWNRVVSLILPSAQITNTARDITTK